MTIGGINEINPNNLTLSDELFSTNEDVNRKT